jgi:hypothetical protein
VCVYVSDYKHSFVRSECTLSYTLLTVHCYIPFSQYDFVDSIQTLYEVLVNLPSEVEKSFEATQYEIERTVEELQRTPEKFQQVVQGTRKSVEETQNNYLKIVNDVQQVPEKVGDIVVGTIKEVQAIPTKVNNSISETKRTIDETRKGVETFAQETKYATGLEQRPPPPPVPPKSPEELRKELALKVAKEAAFFVGKASVVIAQSTASMAVDGVKFALQAVKTAQEKSKKEKKDRDTIRVVAPITKSSSPVIPLSIADIDPMLEKEVAEALRLAEAAVNAPKVHQHTLTPLVESTPKPAINVLREAKHITITSKDINIKEAVNRAKLAAQFAKRDANQLEESLNKRRLAKK